MKNGYIIDQIEDFEIGKCYAIVFRGKIIDCFLCSNINHAANHFLSYSERGCEILRFLSKTEAREIIDNLQYKKSMYFDLFSHSKRGNKGQLDTMCELSSEINKIKELFLK